MATYGGSQGILSGLIKSTVDPSWGDERQSIEGDS